MLLNTLRCTGQSPCCAASGARLGDTLTHSHAALSDACVSARNGLVTAISSDVKPEWRGFDL